MSLGLERVPRWPVVPASVLVVLVIGAALITTWQFVGTGPLCPFRNVTSIPCAGCGATRAVTSILGGDWREGVLHNPMVVAIGAGLLATLALRIGFGRRVALDLDRRQRLIVWVGAGVIFVANWWYVVERHLG